MSNRLNQIIKEEYAALVEKKSIRKSQENEAFGADYKTEPYKYTRPGPRDTPNPPVKKEGMRFNSGLNKQMKNIPAKRIKLNPEELKATMDRFDAAKAQTTPLNYRPGDKVNDGRVNELSPELLTRAAFKRGDQGISTGNAVMKMRNKNIGQYLKDDPKGKMYDVPGYYYGKARELRAHRDNPVGESTMNELSPELKKRYRIATGGGWDRLAAANKNLGTIGLTPTTVKNDTYHELDKFYGPVVNKFRKAARNVGHDKFLGPPEKSDLAESFKNVVKNEFRQMLKEAEEKAPNVESKLETLRKKLVKEGQITSREKGSGRNNQAALPERRIPIATVSELIEVPINELLLHFLNGHRIHEGFINPVEFRLGMVYFYGDEEK